MDAFSGVGLTLVAGCGGPGGLAPFTQEETVQVDLQLPHKNVRAGGICTLHGTLDG